MNISPISLVSKSPNFACQNCKRHEPKHDYNQQEDEVVFVSDGVSQYPVYRLQIDKYTSNYKHSREAIDAHNTSPVDSDKEYIERRKVGE